MGSRDIYGVEIYIEKVYKTYTEKRHIWSEDIHGVKIYIKR